MKIITTEAEFSTEIKEGITVVDFFANWCGPCKMLGPVLKEVAEEMKEVHFVKVDVDQSPALAQKFGIMSIPSVHVFKDGVEAGNFVGLQPKEAIIKFIESHK